MNSRAGAIERREAQAHAFEGACELAELVGGLVDDGLVEAAAGDPLGRRLEPADPASEETARGRSRW